MQMEMRGLVWRHLIIAFSSFKHFVPPVSAVVHVPRLLFCVLVYSQESRRHRHTVRTGAQPQNGTRALSLSIYVPVIRSVCVCVCTPLCPLRGYAPCTGSFLDLLTLTSLKRVHATYFS